MAPEAIDFADAEFAQIGRVAVSFAALEDLIEKSLRTIEPFFPEESEVHRASRWGFAAKCDVLRRNGVRVLDEFGEPHLRNKQREAFSKYIDEALKYAEERNVIVHGVLRTWRFTKELEIEEKLHLVKRNRKTDEFETRNLDDEGLASMTKLQLLIRTLAGNLRWYKITLKEAADRYLEQKAATAHQP